jgi:hypothetical protein
MFLYIQSSVHNDALTNLWAALAVWGIVRYWLRGPSPRRAAFLGLVCGLGALTKITFLFLWPAVALALLGRSWLDRRANPRWWWDLVRLAAITGGLAVLISGWWFVRNQLIYSDPVAMERQMEVWGIRPNAPDVRAAVRELGFLRDSFWGAFGYGQILLPGRVYALLRGFMLIAAGGLILWAIRSWRAGWGQTHKGQTHKGQTHKGQTHKQYRVPAALLAVPALIPLTAFAAVFARMTVSPTADFGRYLFTAYGVIAPAMVLGLTEWLPMRWRGAALGGLAVALAALGVGALAGTLAPAYAPPPIYANANEVKPAHWLKVEYPGLAQLLGYDVTPASAVPGAVVSVTLYWQVTGTTDENYVEFVQLIGENDVRVGGRDTHPGLGRYPTSRWQPGQVIADTIPIPINADARGPAGLRLDLGLHDGDGQRLPTADGQPVLWPGTGDTIHAGVIRLAGREPITPVGDPVHYRLGDLVELVAIQPPSAQTAPGATLPFTLTWNAVRQPDADYVAFVHLLNQAGEGIAQFDGPPVRGTFPTSLWQPGDVVVDARQMRLPDDLPDGTYHVVAGWYRLDTMVRLPVSDAAGRPLPDGAIPLFALEVKSKIPVGGR